jgi:hypothetical protein
VELPPRGRLGGLARVARPSRERLAIRSFIALRETCFELYERDSRADVGRELRDDG